MSRVSLLFIYLHRCGRVSFNFLARFGEIGYIWSSFLPQWNSVARPITIRGMSFLTSYIVSLGISRVVLVWEYTRFKWDLLWVTVPRIWDQGSSNDDNQELPSSCGPKYQRILSQNETLWAGLWHGRPLHHRGSTWWSHHSWWWGDSTQRGASCCHWLSIVRSGQRQQEVQWHAGMPFKHDTLMSFGLKLLNTHVVLPDPLRVTHRTLTLAASYYSIDALSSRPWFSDWSYSFISTLQVRSKDPRSVASYTIKSDLSEFICSLCSIPEYKNVLTGQIDQMVKFLRKYPKYEGIESIKVDLNLIEVGFLGFNSLSSCSGSIIIVHPPPFPLPKGVLLAFGG